LIDQYVQLLELLKRTTSDSSSDTNNDKRVARFTIDVQCGTVDELDLFNLDATNKYWPMIRDTSCLFVAREVRAVHLQIQRYSFDELPFTRHCQATIDLSRWTCKARFLASIIIVRSSQFQLSSIGGYLQLDRCIYPYIVSSSTLLLNLNDLRKPFVATLNKLVPYFRRQPATLLDNYAKIVDYGTRYIKNYKYYYKDIDDKFISLDHLLLLHRSLFFVQLFHINRTSLTNLHEFYRADFTSLLSNNLMHCVYSNGRPCVNGWSLVDASVSGQRPSRLATRDELLLINWLLIYDQRAIQVHQQIDDIIVSQPLACELNEQVRSIENEHQRKRAESIITLDDWPIEHRLGSF
jgi:hypothetical protein